MINDFLKVPFDDSNSCPDSCPDSGHLKDQKFGYEFFDDEFIGDQIYKDEILGMRNSDGLDNQDNQDFLEFEGINITYRTKQETCNLEPGYLCC